MSEFILPVQPIDILAQSVIARLDVAGTLASAGGESGSALVGLVTSRRLFGLEGRVTRLDILVDEGSDIDALAVALPRLPGPVFSVGSSRARATDMQRLVRGCLLRSSLWCLALLWAICVWRVWCLQ